MGTERVKNLDINQTVDPGRSVLDPKSGHFGHFYEPFFVILGVFGAFFGTPRARARRNFR